MTESTEIELQAAAFRRLVAHLDENKQVQNIDLMNLAGFCRNCLSKWYRAAAEDKGIEMDYEEAREVIYGMPYADWKAKYQTEANAEQLAAFQESHKDQLVGVTDFKRCISLTAPTQYLIRWISPFRRGTRFA